MSEITGKRCAKCSETKPLNEFGTDRHAPDGLNRRCHDCRRQADRDRYAANPEAGRESTRRWRAADPEASRKATRESMRRWMAANPEAVRDHGRRWYVTYKSPVFDHYGHECTCCGTSERLTIDHVNGDGKAHREQLRGGSPALYRWLIKNDFPEGFQVLCLRCNQSKSNGDHCRLDHAVAA